MHEAWVLTIFINSFRFVVLAIKTGLGSVATTPSELRGLNVNHCSDVFCRDSFPSISDTVERTNFDGTILTSPIDTSVIFFSTGYREVCKGLISCVSRCNKKSSYCWDDRLMPIIQYS